MAIDEMLLDGAREQSGCTWRFYQWSEPTLSLGYFQSHASRQWHAASRDCALVRRLSGGGAILHHHDLTYSLVVPAGHPWARDAESLYRAVHAALISALAACGVAGATLHERASAAGMASEPFLCFQRRSGGDVVLGRHKIAGSAQRRRRGAVLQHGSVLLASSHAAPELPGVADVAGVVVSAEQLRAAWLPEAARRLGLDVFPSAYSTEERTRTAEIEQSRFTQTAWNARR